MNKKIEILKEKYAVKDIIYVGLLKVKNIKNNKKGHTIKIKFKDITNNINRIFYFNQYISLPKLGEEYHYTQESYFYDIFNQKTICYSLDNLNNKHINIYVQNNRQFLFNNIVK